ncbi:MAG: glutathione peroxidase [Kiritimatiellia bacterium]
MKLLMISFLSFLFSSSLKGDETSVHAFTLNSIQGEEVDLSAYKGKVLLIVNTASKCGFTKQYADLVELQKNYAEKDFVILGFPANNFGGQEPGSNQEIAEFCSARFGVEFPMFTKVSVKGADQHPLFGYLTSAENEDFKGDIRWNFEKFLVDADGVLQRRFRSKTTPTSEELTEAIEVLLTKSSS